MAIYKTKTGYRIRYYDADGIERKRTIKGITREEAVRREREILALRDRGERIPNSRTSPAFKPFAQQWLEKKPIALETFHAWTIRTGTQMPALSALWGTTPLQYF